MSEKTFFQKVSISSKYGSLKNIPQKDSSFKSITISKVNRKFLPSSAIFRNQELKKSIDSNPIILKNTNNNTDENYSDFSKLDTNSGFITLIPIEPYKSKKKIGNLNLYKSLPKIKFDVNKKFELIAYNDEKCFRTARPQKKVSFPKKYTILKKYRIYHDINSYNRNNYACDYMKDYQKNSYKIKKLVNDSKFLNKIKKDLITLKYDQKIKPFEL